MGNSPISDERKKNGTKYFIYKCNTNYEFDVPSCPQKKREGIVSETSLSTSTSRTSRVDKAPLDAPAFEAVVDDTRIVLKIFPEEETILLRGPVFSDFFKVLYQRFFPGYRHEHERLKPPESLLGENVDLTVQIDGSASDSRYGSNVERVPQVSFASESTAPAATGGAIAAWLPTLEVGGQWPTAKCLS